MLLEGNERIRRGKVYCAQNEKFATSFMKKRHNGLNSCEQIVPRCTYYSGKLESSQHVARAHAFGTDNTEDTSIERSSH